MKRKPLPKPKKRSQRTKGACPTPGKVSYKDRETAQRFARGGKPYRCPTGQHWHVTTKAAKP